MERTLTIDGMECAVSLRPGKGKIPILFINGMSRTQDIYGPLRSELSAPTVAFDFPKSWKIFHPLPSIADIAHFIEALIDELGYSHVDIFGVSWGGAPAVTFTQLHGERVRNLVLAATITNPVALLLNPKVYYAPLVTMYGGKVARNALLMQRFEEEVGKTLFHTDWYRSHALMRWSARNLSKINHPTLLFAGREDGMVSMENMRGFEEIPNSKLHVLDDGHIFVWSSAKEVARKLEMWQRSMIVA